MKICFLAGTLGQGGAERQMLYMLKALKNSGVDCRVMCLTKDEIYQNRIEALGIKVDYVGEKSGRLSRLATIAGNLKNKRADIIQSAHFYTNIYAAIAGRFLSVRSIGAVRNDLKSEIGADRIFGKWQARLPENLIANSRIAIERAEDFGISAKKLHFVKNVVNLPFDKGKLPEKDGDRLNVLFVGRLTEPKRPETFLGLADYLKRSLAGREIHFQVVGDGSLLSSLKRSAQKMHLSDNEVTFYGDREDVANFYQNADLLVLPSIYEGTPNVVLEAMSYGVPVIATRVGGVPDIVNEKRGILVEPTDIKALFEETRKLVLDKDLRRKLGAEGKKYVSENHSLDYLQKRLTEIYIKIIN